MILAAGLGTRLRPLTDTRPKALVEIGGRTLLEITLARLRMFDVTEVIINVHHFADAVVDYLNANDHFGMRIEISREDVLLDTGGGLKKAAHFFTKERGAGEPFILHNVDVVSTIDLRRMLEFHTQHGALATLAVQDRQSARYLLFDERLQLCGRRTETQTEIARPCNQEKALAFCGIHVISPALFGELREEGVFSIIPPYLRLAGAGKKILAFRADGYDWRDLGTPDKLTQAGADLNRFGF